MSRVGDRIVLELLEDAPFDVAAWRARLGTIGARDFLAEGLLDEPPLARDDVVSLD